MEFELTPEIAGEVIFAMEDQTGHFLFDSAECRCVDAHAVPAGPNEDEDRYYSIPVWDSVNGFRMMDRFVGQLRNPVARERLRAVLALGHGVFRGFKDALKERPEVERLWIQFKERELRSAVADWYDGLRDYWGARRVGDEPEETGEIVSQDFAFRPFSGEDDGCLDSLLSSVRLEIVRDLPQALSDAVDELATRLEPADGAEEWVLFAETAGGELAGAARSFPVPHGSLLSVQLSAIVVYPEFRGLGVGSSLLERTIAHWAGRGYRWMVCASPVVPEPFARVLRRAGFAQKGHVSVLDLSGDRPA